MLFQNNREFRVVDSRDGMANQREHVADREGYCALRTTSKSPLLAPNAREMGTPIGISQKLKVACSSMRRLAVPPCEKGPPCRELGLSKIGEPSVELGFATFTLLNRFRTPTPM